MPADGCDTLCISHTGEKEEEGEKNYQAGGKFTELLHHGPGQVGPGPGLTHAGPQTQVR